MQSNAKTSIMNIESPKEEHNLLLAPWNNHIMYPNGDRTPSSPQSPSSPFFPKSPSGSLNRR